MNKKLKNIKVLVWDVDGTLYQSIPDYSFLVEKKEYELLSRVKKIPLVVAKKLLREKKKIYKSATKTLVKLGCGDFRFVGRETETEDKAKFIKKDPRLLEVFKELIDFRHLALRNGALKGTMEILEALGLGEFLPAAKSSGRLPLRQNQNLAHHDGLSFGPFEKVFGTIDNFGTVKPDPVIFEKILEYTGSPASQHLMIGDRVEVDLVPAKKLGMRTCLVWGKSEIADVSIPTVYDIVKVVISE